MNEARAYFHGGPGDGQTLDIPESRHLLFFSVGPQWHIDANENTVLECETACYERVSEVSLYGRQIVNYDYVP